MNKSYILILLFLLSLIFSACKANLEDVKTNLKQGKYLEATQGCIKAIQDPDLEPEAKTYLRDNAKPMMQNALTRGQSLLKEPSEAAILYFQAFLGTISDLEKLHLDFGNAKAFKSSGEKFLSEAKTNYVSYAEKNAAVKFKNRQYREATFYWDQAKKYRPEDSSLGKKSEKARDLASRRLCFLPIRNYSSEIPNERNLRETWESTQKTKARFLALENITITDQAHDQFSAQFSKKKSNFLDVETLNKIDPQSDYVVISTIDAVTSQKAKKKIIMDKTFDQIEYAVTVTLRAHLFIRESGENIGDFERIETVVAEEKTEGDLDRPETVKRAVEKVVTDITDDILMKIDHDLDPITLMQSQK